MSPSGVLISRRAMHVGRLILGACLIVSTLLIGGCATISAWFLKHDVEGLRQAANGELQRKRGVLTSERSLQQLDRLDIAVSLPLTELLRFRELLLASLRVDKKIQKEHINLLSLDLSLNGQEIIATIDLEMPVGPTKVQAKVIASGLVGAIDGGIMLNMFTRGIALEKITISSGAKDISGLAGLINKALDDALGIINIALDYDINRNPKKAAVLWLDQATLLNQELQRSDTPTLKFAPKTIKTAMVAQATGVLVEQDRLVVLVKAGFTSPTEVPERLPTLPNIGEIVTLDPKEADKRIADYQATLRSRLTAAFGPAFESRKNPIVAMTKEAAARAINNTLSQTPIQATAILNEQAKESKDLSFTITERDCQDLINGCKFKNVCDNRSICQTERVEQVADMACKAACIVHPNIEVLIFHRNPRRDCENACGTIQRTILIPIHNATCDGFIAWDQLHGGVGCNIASNIDRATCDIDKNLQKSACDIQQEARRFFDHNAFATVESDIRPNITLDVGVQAARITSDLLSLTLKANVGGSGPVDVGLKYVRRVPYDALVFGTGVSWGLCTTNWSEHDVIAVKASSSPYDLTFVAQMSEDHESGALVFEYQLQGEAVVKMNLTPPPISAFFVGKPNLALNCPLIAIGSFSLGTLEAVVKPEEQRQIFPLLTGENYPFKVTNQSFRLSIPKLILCRSADKSKCEEDSLRLTPRSVGTVIVFTQ